MYDLFGLDRPGDNPQYLFSWRGKAAEQPRRRGREAKEAREVQNGSEAPDEAQDHDKISPIPIDQSLISKAQQESQRETSAERSAVGPSPKAALRLCVAL